MTAAMPPPADDGAGAAAEVHAETRIVVANQWQLIWWKFRKHRLAMLAGLVTIFLYVVALFAEFFAPYSARTYSAQHTFLPPQSINLFQWTGAGWRFFPHVYGHKVQIDQESFKRTYVLDETITYPVGLFVQGEEYKLWGLFTLDVHLIGAAQFGDPVHLIGTDRLGRDVLSRTIYGTRVSMSVGLVGVGLSLLLGVILGGISGYYGGLIDNLIQRTIEILRSLPTIPLWMGLSAAIPLTWPPVRVYFAITVLLSLIGWTALAREVRGRFLSLKTEDFVIAARLDGVREIQIILRHMVPSMTSHIIASVTLAIPGMILAETALSFLGIGLRPPVVSWGVLLQEAQNVRSIATAPWLLFPGLAVVVAVLAMNFLGDGLRDAADPYQA
ncbi:MAG: ABC transporter permease [Chloroflexi bacterium]|nr:ABC transporter permease [Chloroflexota bacterium]